VCVVKWTIEKMCISSAFVSIAKHTAAETHAINHGFV